MTEVGPCPDRGVRGLAAALYVPVTFLSFPQLLNGHEIDLGLLLGWLGPALLLFALRGTPPGIVARRAFLASWLAHAAILHWGYVVTVVHGEAPAWLGVLAPFGMALYAAAMTALAAYVWAWLGRRGLADPFTTAAVLVLADLLREFVGGGFPWAVIGYAQHENAWLLPWAAWTGVYGLCFVTYLLGAAAAEALCAWRSGRAPALSSYAAVAVVVLVHGIGASLTLLPEREPLARLRIAAVQGNIEQDRKWSVEVFEETLDRYERLSAEAVAAGARLVVWPETAIPGALELEEAALTRVKELARRTGAAYVVGSVGVAVDRDIARVTDYYDSAFAFDADGRAMWRYDKSHLVPFGEYLPLRWLLGDFLETLAGGVAPMDVTPGVPPRAMRLGLSAEAGPSQVAAGDVHELKLGTPICYELLFPDITRRFVKDGAQVLVAITNDAWYGRTGAPHQFLAMTAMRSAETRAWTVRAANTGISAIIDGRGRVRERTSIFETGLLVADVPLLPADDASGRSFYVRHGNVFAWGCAGWVMARIAFAWIRPRRTGPGGADASQRDGNGDAAAPMDSRRAPN